jgi:DNA-binding XRE family transcriptional regulator
VDLSRRLAEALRAMREEAGLTHAEMAKRLRISRPTYTRLENADQNTTLKTLGQLCRALRCDVGDLFGGELERRRQRRR